MGDWKCVLWLVLVGLAVASCGGNDHISQPGSATGTSSGATPTTEAGRPIIEQVVEDYFAAVNAGDFSFLQDDQVTLRFGFGPVKYTDPAHGVLDFDESGISTWGDPLLDAYMWMDAVYHEYERIECINFGAQAQCTVWETHAFARLAMAEPLPYVLMFTTRGPDLVGITWDIESQPAEEPTVETFAAEFLEWIRINDPSFFAGLAEGPNTASTTLRFRSALAEWLPLMGMDDVGRPGAFPLSWVAPQASGIIEQTSGTNIEIFNGTDRLTNLVEWALGRFELIGIGLPNVVAVTFPPIPLCDEYQGMATNTGEGSRVYVCYDEQEACSDDSCSDFNIVARRTMLHELGHAWNNTYLNDEDREMFVEMRGLDYWSGSDVTYSSRGTEHAAEVLVWGLLEESSPTIRLPDQTCDTLAEAFQFLTGAEPLFDLTDCDPWPY